jgi:hypothetical protein
MSIVQVCLVENLALVKSGTFLQDGQTQIQILSHLMSQTKETVFSIQIHECHKTDNYILFH